MTRNAIKILLFFSVLVFSTNTFAWRQMNASINFSSQYIEARVVNTFMEPQECRGKVFGMNQFGQTVTQRFHFRGIGPGSYRVAYVYAYGNIYFVNGWANVKCRIDPDYDYDYDDDYDDYDDYDDDDDDDDDLWY